MVKGHGELTVVNGNSEDAAVILAGEPATPAFGVETPDRLFHVRARMEATISEIPPGRYRIKFQIGKNWDSEAETFQCLSATAMFDQGEDFKEEKTEKGVRSSSIRVTLHRVVGGTARTRPINAGAFRRRRKIR